MKIIVRDLCANDKSIIFKWISNPKLRKMIGTRGIPSEESHNKWFLNKLLDTENITKIIVCENVPVGLLGTNQIDRFHKNADIYIYIGEEKYKRLGIAFYSIALLKEFLFYELGLHKICARVFSYNEPSLRLFKKCGFTVEGILREHIFVDHQYWNVVLLACLHCED